MKNTIVKNLRNPCRLKKENKTIRERITRDIRNLFELEEDYHKPAKVGTFYINVYIEYE